MDHHHPSVCRLHPGVAVTGFCPACLRDRLAGLRPPSAADLRRCKSFSYARSAASLEPQRRSCDLFRHQQEEPMVPEEDLQAPVHQQKSSRSLGGLLGKKLQQWRRKSKKQEPEPATMPVPVPMLPPDPRRASTSWEWDMSSGLAPPALARLPIPIPVEEDDDMMAPPIPRSDGQIPVEEDYDYDRYYYDDSAAAAVPGSSAQTRDYYLDSSSSSRRRRSVDRSTTSGRNSFSLSDANNAELPLPSGRMMAAMNNGSNSAGNARVSPAIAAERLYHYHHEAQSVLVHHHQYCRDDELLQGPNDLIRVSHDFSGSFGSAFRDHRTTSSKPKKGIKGWSIWGLIHKKSKSAAPDLHGNGPFVSSGDQAAAEEHPWPELRARGFNGQMLRCNSSISARSSFSGGASAIIGDSGRRSISGADMRDGKNNGHRGRGGLSDSRRRIRRDEVLLERNMSTTRSSSSSYTRSAALAGAAGHGLDPPVAMAPMGMQYHHHLSRPPNVPRRSSSKHEFSSLARRI